MPHKRNPIGSENLSGLARILRANAMASLENIPLWHERDISHSSVERVIAPDSTILLDYMLNRLTNIIKKLIVYPDRMAENLGKLKGLIFSQQILLALASAGASREEAYERVQANALKVWRHKKDFKTLILADPQIVKYLSRKKIEELFDVSYHLKYISAVFKRVFDI